MKKKLLSLILAAVMAGSLVGCGSKAPAAAASSEAGSAEAPATGAADTAESAKGFAATGNPEEWPTITVQVPVLSEMADEQMVEDALNEYLVSINAGVKADMVQMTLGDLSTQLTLMLSDNQQPLDLFCWRFYSTLDGCVKNEQCIPLDQYIPIYGKCILKMC